MGGGKRYATNVCMYVALFRSYSGMITQIAHRRARCKRCKESVPLIIGDDAKNPKQGQVKQQIVTKCAMSPQT